jgi:transcriptional regulator with XRE-family HTH domain
VVDSEEIFLYAARVDICPPTLETMPLTEFGKVMRELREIADVSLREMAQAIDLSPTYLSAVEMGEKGVTEELVEKALAFMQKRKVPMKDLTRLRAAADRIRRAVDVSDLNQIGRRAVATFARRWADLDREARQRFLRQLNIVDETE